VHIPLVSEKYPFRGKAFFSLVIRVKLAYNYSILEVDFMKNQDWLNPDYLWGQLEEKAKRIKKP